MKRIIQPEKGAAPKGPYSPGIVVDGPVDIVGAGDAVTSATVPALLGGATPVEAATLGNLAASILSLIHI